MTPWHEVPEEEKARRGWFCIIFGCRFGPNKVEIARNEKTRTKQRRLRCECDQCGRVLATDWEVTGRY